MDFCRRLTWKFVLSRALIITLAFGSWCTASVSHAGKIKVLTYNTWGVPLTAWDTWRYERAMRAIESINPDVVLLNEVFTRKGKRNFKSWLYPFQASGPGPSPRLVGSGLTILSKFPILQRATLAYRACKGTDCLSRKGAALTILQLPNGKKLNLIGTHLDASGPRSIRISQLKQLEIFSQTYSDTQAPTILAGDMNFRSQSEEHEYTRKSFQVEDAWMQTHSSNEPGYTYDCNENHYAREYANRTNEPMIRERLDYLFHKGAILPLQTELKLNDQENLFSDHYALMGEFEI